MIQVADHNLYLNLINGVLPKYPYCHIFFSLSYNNVIIIKILIIILLGGVFDIGSENPLDFLIL